MRAEKKGKPFTLGRANNKKALMIISVVLNGEKITTNAPPK